MASDSGEWILRGIEEDDPGCLHSPEELIKAVDELGFLPLFHNTIPGFSVEERTPALWWWAEEEARDPWVWREVLARSGRVAYGKFFGHKAGFLSLAWLPYFANARRDGYDFDARWDEGFATQREKKIMDALGEDELFSFQLRQKAGFGKGGEKNFEGTISQLQMQTYLVVRDFRSRVNKLGQPYGWHIAVYTTPEHLWGYDLVTSAYVEEPERSRERIARQMETICPQATHRQIEALLR